MKPNNELTQQQMAWIEEHQWLFNGPSRSVDRETGIVLFGIYSWVTGKNQRMTGCGRCAASAKETVWAQYKKQQQ